MPPKDSSSELQIPDPETRTHLQAVARFLRLLTWQMFFLLAILAYILMRPQAGRYQFTVAGGEVLVFDTASSRAMAIKLQRQEAKSMGENPTPGAPTAPEENKQ